MSWIEILSKDLDDIYDYARGLPLHECPEHARILLDFIEHKELSIQLRRNAARALEALPPNLGVIGSWPEEASFEMVQKLLAIDDLFDECLSAVIAIAHHSVTTPELRTEVIQLIKERTNPEKAIRVLSTPRKIRGSM